jgi:hypothetical protein
MAFFYFALLFGLGTTALLHGIGSLSRDRGQEPPQSIPPRVESMENWWLRDPLLYIVLTIIIAGIYYRYRTRRNGSKR